jgi:KTSC domain
MNKLRLVIPPELWPWRLPVRSSAISSVGYNPHRSELSLKFRDGRVYRYPGVARTIFHGLITAPSLGHYFNATIRPNIKPC